MGAAPRSFLFSKRNRPPHPFADTNPLLHRLSLPRFARRALYCSPFCGPSGNAPPGQSISAQNLPRRPTRSPRFRSGAATTLYEVTHDPREASKPTSIFKEKELWFTTSAGAPSRVAFFDLFPFPTPDVNGPAVYIGSIFDDRGVVKGGRPQGHLKDGPGNKKNRAGVAPRAEPRPPPASLTLPSEQINRQLVPPPFNTSKTKSSAAVRQPNTNPACPRLYETGARHIRYIVVACG